MPEVTVDLKELETKFEKKLDAKNSEVATLKAQLDEFNKSVTKAALDAKDGEIVTLKADLAKVTTTLNAANLLVAEKVELAKTSDVKITELNTTVVAKTEELAKATKELGEIRTKALVESRIKSYRDKSKDTLATNEDLTKKFSGLTDEAFATVLEFVKETVPVVVTDPAKLAASVVDTAKKTGEVQAVAPTSTTTDSNALKSVVARLVASTMGDKVEKETK